MISSELKLSKAEWRQVSNIAAQMDLVRRSSGRNELFDAGLSDRASAALHQLLRVM